MRQWILFDIYTVFIIVILVGAYLDVIPTEIAIVPAYDSVGHFVLYGIWFFLLHSALQGKWLSVLSTKVPQASLILSPIIVLEEYAQKFASTRTFSFGDLFWGILGMFTFLCLYHVLGRT
jgi:polysaccharide biosynthesis protein VpsQ